MICYLKDTQRDNKEKARGKEKEIVERKRKESAYVCGYPMKNYNRRTSKMSFFSTTHTRIYLPKKRYISCFFFLISSSTKKKKKDNIIVMFLVMVIIFNFDVLLLIMKNQK